MILLSILKILIILKTDSAVIIKTWLSILKTGSIVNLKTDYTVNLSHCKYFLTDSTANSDSKTDSAFFMAGSTVNLPYEWFHC